MFINITTAVVRQFFQYWEAVKFLVADTIFPKLLILAVFV